MAKPREIHLRGAAADAAPNPTARFPALVDVDANGPARLRRTRAGLIGAGAIGDSISSHLARLSPELLLIVDRSNYKPESVLTDAACADPSLSGRPKAGAAALRAKKVSPGTTVLAFDGPFEELSPADLLDADLDVLFLCGDNLALEVGAGQFALHFGIPLVHAAVHGETLTAQCRMDSMSDPATGPCPACGLSERGEWDAVGGDATFSCAPGEPAGRVPHPDRTPTRSLSFLCSIAADLAVGLWVRRRLGIGEEPPDFCLEWAGYRLSSTVTSLERNPGCRCDHRRLEPRKLAGPLALSSPESVADVGGVGLTGGSIRIPGYRFVRIGICGCAEERAVGRFLREGAALPPCRCCGEPVRPHPFYTAETVPGEWLEPHRGVSLHGLGAGGARSAFVCRNGHGAFVTGGDDKGGEDENG